VEKYNPLKNQKETSELITQLELVKQELRESREESKLAKSDLETQKALYNQKVTFYEQQLKESEIQQRDNEKSYDALMNAFKRMDEEKDYSQGNVQDMIQQQRADYISGKYVY
jgi:hypothetical protein